jgi:hypothetical protein
MTIKFQCEHCGKKIEAPSDVGGKRGRCPACKNPVYIPRDTETDQEEELKLAPLDEDDEIHQKELIAETFKVGQDILKEKGITEPEDTNEQPAASGPFIPPVQYKNKEIKDYILKYLRLVADGELDQANDIIEILTDNAEQARAIIDDIALSEIPEPDLAKIPPQVLSALIRNLRNQISQ